MNAGAGGAVAKAMLVWRVQLGNEKKEARSGKRTREEEKEENETVSAKRRFVGYISAEAFDIFSQGEYVESCGGVSWSDLLEKPDDLSDGEPETGTVVSALPVVTDVLVSSSSVVTECYEEVSVDSDWEFVEPQSFSFSQKALVCLCGESGRNELRRVASKNASDIQKKDDRRGLNGGRGERPNRGAR